MALIESLTLSFRTCFRLFNCIDYHILNLGMEFAVSHGVTCTATLLASDSWRMTLAEERSPAEDISNILKHWIQLITLSSTQAEPYYHFIPPGHTIPSG